MTVYGQTEVTKDLMAAREAAQLTSFYEAHNVQVKDFYTAPKVEFEYQGKAFQIQCDFIAGVMATMAFAVLACLKIKLRPLKKFIRLAG